MPLFRDWTSCYQLSQVYLTNVSVAWHADWDTFMKVVMSR